MKHGTKILADRILGTPAAIVFNIFARVFGFLLSRNHTATPENTRTIVVAKLVGMGSAIQATPLIRQLRTHFPKAKIVFLTVRANAAIVSRFEHIDQVVIVDDSSPVRLAGSALAAMLQLMKLRVDCYFDLEIYSAFASIFSLLTLSRNRIGFYRHSIQFKRGIYTHLVYFNTRMPIRMLYLQLAQALKLPEPASVELGTILLSDAEKADIRPHLAKLVDKPGFTPKSRYLIINPNASDLLLERRWPRESVARTIDALAKKNVFMLLVGSPSEAPYVQSILDLVSSQSLPMIGNTAGRLTLIQLASAIDQAACVLTNDTGPMHLAFALRRPTVCLFGPVHPDHYGMSEPHVTTIYAPVICSPCVHEIDSPPCDGDNVCMQRITPELVIDAVMGALDPSPAMPRNVRLPLWVHTPQGVALGIVRRIP